jgi:hypothetical protein
MDLPNKLRNLFEDIKLIRDLGDGLTIQSTVIDNNVKDVERLATMLLLVQSLSLPEIDFIFEDIPQPDMEVAEA